MAKFPQSVGKIARKSAKTVHSHKTRKLGEIKLFFPVFLDFASFDSLPITTFSLLLFFVFLENYKPIETWIFPRELCVKETLSLNTAAKFIRHLLKFVRICTNVSFHNLVKNNRPGCMGQHNEILISQVQAIFLNE